MFSNKFTVTLTYLYAVSFNNSGFLACMHYQIQSHCTFCSILSTCCVANCTCVPTGACDFSLHSHSESWINLSICLYSTALALPIIWTKTMLLIPLNSLLASAAKLHILKLFIESESSGLLAHSWSHSRICGDLMALRQSHSWPVFYPRC